MVSKKQSVVAKSSVEAKFRKLAHGICEDIWIRKLLEELKFSRTMPMCTYCDNKTTISIAHNLALHDRTKYIGVDRYFIKKKIDVEVISIPYLPPT